ncbi:MAG: phosphatidate cytidylyltransferase [Mycoplasmoidaceae bacterium]
MLNKFKIQSISQEQKKKLRNRTIISIGLIAFWLLLLIYSLLSTTDILSRKSHSDVPKYLSLLFSILTLFLFIPFLLISYYEINKIFFEEIISINYLNKIDSSIKDFIKIYSTKNKKSFYILNIFFLLSFLISSISLIIKVTINNFHPNQHLSVIIFCSMILSFLIWFLTTFFLLWKFKINNFRDIFTFFLLTFFTNAGFISLFYITINQGFGMLLFIFVIVVFSDTFAYIGGMFFGKRQLSPNISPNKTVEGFLIGFFASIIIAMALSGFLYWIDISTKSDPLLNNHQEILDSIVFGMYSSQQIPGFDSIVIQNLVTKNLVVFISVFILAVVLSLVASAGDIFYSYIKRVHSIKDYSKILGEHGGVLDRFDSIIFASTIYTLIYFIVLIFIQFFNKK